MEDGLTENLYCFLDTKVSGWLGRHTVRLGIFVHVLWTDERKFNLVSHDGKMRVRRAQNETLMPDCVLPRAQGGGGSVINRD